VRPTSDRVREALFDILSGQVEGCRFLDLYAGSGAVGIEALSRGADQAVFVEQDPGTLRALRRNLEDSRLAPAGRVLGMAVRPAIQRLAGEGIRFDLMYADPPYGDAGERTEVLQRLGRGDLLRPGACIVLEHPARQAPRVPEALEILREARYGDTQLAFLRWHPSA
jgi:16S rRNA (guanine(966)-N(2))-methyltransferase RsmD